MNVLVSLSVYVGVLVVSMKVILMMMLSVYATYWYMNDIKVEPCIRMLCYILMAVYVMVILGILGMLVSWMLSYATLGQLGM